MKRFREYLQERNEYPTWIRVSVGLLALRVRTLSNRIATETDPEKQNRLIAQQNKYLAYMNGLGIATNTSDKPLMNRMRQGLK